ncbi:MAG: phosphatase, partial [Actinobacteria bacterium]|nr:phosphatase [Actinomycetota bacterium]
MAITDHDTTSGWDEAISAARREGIGLVPGIEVSTRSEIGNGRRISVHILAYLPNPEHPELVEALAKTRDSRVGRARTMVDLLSRDYEISWADIEAQIEPGATVGRP